MNGGPKEINAELIAGLPDDGPVVMVNLVRYRDRAEYKRYSELAMPLIKQLGLEKNVIIATSETYSKFKP
jgi:hypothetical protein